MQFKAWSYERKKFLNLYDVDQMLLATSLYFDQEPKGNGLELSVAENVDFIKCTDMNDIKGKRMYEGDVVNYGTTGYGVIEYSHGCFWAKRGVYSLLNVMDRVEVIGNVYENPELINKYNL